MTVFYDVIRWEAGSKSPEAGVDAHMLYFRRSVEINRYGGLVPTKVVEIKYTPEKRVVGPPSKDGALVSESVLAVDFTEPPEGYSLDAWIEDTKKKLLRAINDAA